jgi:hypothetical protein
MNYFS